MLDKSIALQYIIYRKKHNTMYIREVSIMFIVAGLILTVSIGAFMSLLLTSEMKDGWKRNIISVIIALIVGFGISGLLMIEQEGYDKAWNNGHCECGTEWTLVDVERTRHGGKFYYYQCNDCKKIIEIK